MGDMRAAMRGAEGQTDREAPEDQTRMPRDRPGFTRRKGAPETRRGSMGPAGSRRARNGGGGLSCARTSMSAAPGTGGIVRGRAGRNRKTWGNRGRGGERGRAKRTCAARSATRRRRGVGRVERLTSRAVARRTTAVGMSDATQDRMSFRRRPSTGWFALRRRLRTRVARRAEPHAGRTDHRRGQGTLHRIGRVDRQPRGRRG